MLNEFPRLVNRPAKDLRLPWSIRPAVRVIRGLRADRADQEEGLVLEPPRLEDPVA